MQIFVYTSVIFPRKYFATLSEYLWTIYVEIERMNGWPIDY